LKKKVIGLRWCKEAKKRGEQQGWRNLKSRELFSQNSHSCRSLEEDPPEFRQFQKGASRPFLISLPAVCPGREPPAR
jgi:hypothetical protein